MESIYENPELCAKCGGKCCKKGGCQYAPTDFESLKFDYLLEKLQEGFISIVCALDFIDYKGNLSVQPFLYVKSRNTNRPIIDLLSMRTRCSALTDNGCMYDFNHRPSGGINLIPDPKNCYPKKDPIEFIKMWQPQQQVLKKLVKRITGKSVESQLKEDAYNLFKDILARKFSGIAPEEIQDILAMMPNLATVYPNEFQKAYLERQILFPGDDIYHRGK